MATRVVSNHHDKKEQSDSMIEGSATDNYTSKVGWIAGISLAAGVALYAILFFDGSAASYRLWYYTPAALAAGSITVERYRQYKLSRWCLFTDIPLALVCLSRPFFGWPAASGHAAFFVYILLTGKTFPSRLFAVFLGAVTLYAKIWRWHGDATLVPGLLIGLLAGGLYRWIVADKS